MRYFTICIHFGFILVTNAVEKLTTGFESQ